MRRASASPKRSCLRLRSKGMIFTGSGTTGSSRRSDDGRSVNFERALRILGRRARAERSIMIRGAPEAQVLCFAGRHVPSKEPVGEPEGVAGVGVPLGAPEA